MIIWALEHENTNKSVIYTSQGTVIDSFHLEDIQVMYKLPDIELTYNVALLENFTHQECVKLGRKICDLIKQWKNTEHKFKGETSKEYSTSSLKPPFIYHSAMLCRIFGRKYVSIFILSRFLLYKELLMDMILIWKIYSQIV